LEWFIYAFGSAIFIAIAHLLNKKVLKHEHALEFSASRGLLSLILALILIPFINFQIPIAAYFAVFFVAIMVGAGTIFFMKSIRHGDISNITPLTNISPLFLLIIAFFVLGEIPSKRQYIGVFLLLLGTYALEVGVNNKGFLEPIKIFFKSKVIHHMIFAMGIFSITATMDKLIVGSYVNQWTYLFLLMIFRSGFLIAVETYQNSFKEIIKDIKKDFKLLSINSTSLFIADILYLSAVAIPGAMISLIIPIKRMSTLFTTMFGGRMFHENNLLVKVLACIIMIWGAVFILL
jgi:transporter family protein